MFKKKGQAALEYLMTYGWAIIVIIAVVAILYGMGVLTPKAPAKCNPCFAGDLAYSDHSVNELVLKAGRDLNITNVDGCSNTWTGSEKYDSGDTISIGLGLSSGYDSCDINVTFNVIDGAEGHVQSATLHET